MVYLMTKEPVEGQYCSPLYIRGKYQYFESNDRIKYRRLFDFSGKCDHGQWEVTKE